MPHLVRMSLKETVVLACVSEASAIDKKKISQFPAKASR